MSNEMIELQKIFLEEAQDLLVKAEEGIMAFDAGDHSENRINDIFRVAHSFKGSAKSVGFNDLSAFSHKFEDLLSRLKSRSLEITPAVTAILFKGLDTLKEFVAGLTADTAFTMDVMSILAEIADILEGRPASDPHAAATQPHTSGGSSSHVEGLHLFEEEGLPGRSRRPASKTVPESTASPQSDAIRVATSKLDALLNTVGELVVNYNMLMEHRALGTVSSEHAMHTMGYTLSIVKELQDHATSLRMVPVKPLVQKLQRAVRDVSTHLSRPVQFDVIGDHVELEKTVLEKMTDPLTHIVRNAVDHGIEPPEQRAAAHKDGLAIVRLEIQQRDDQVEIVVEDDGGGLDRDKILAKAIKQGLVKPERAEALADSEVFALLFLPGFSTKAEVTEISGRGVGLDVVKRAIEELKGSITVSSTLGKGSRFKILLPQSFSIVAGMVVLIEGRRYIVPVSQLEEALEYRHYQSETVTGVGRVVNVRGTVMPVYSLSEILHKKLGPRSLSSAATSHSPNDRRTGLITAHEGRKVSFEVDEILGQQQVVLKKLGREMEDLPGVTAGAILANGEPGLVLDLVDLARRKQPHAA